MSAKLSISCWKQSAPCHPSCQLDVWSCLHFVIIAVNQLLKAVYTFSSKLSISCWNLFILVVQAVNQLLKAVYNLSYKLSISCWKLSQLILQAVNQLEGAVWTLKSGFKANSKWLKFWSSFIYLSVVLSLVCVTNIKFMLNLLIMFFFNTCGYALSHFPCFSPCVLK